MPRPLRAVLGVGRAVAVAALLASVLTTAALGVLTLRGEQLMVVTSGSMAPAVQAGDAVLVRPVHEGDLRPGAVVVFRSPQREGTTTHRVQAVHDRPEGTFLQTRGDANSATDVDWTAAEDVVGMAGPVLPAAGRWLVLWGSAQGRLLLVALPLLLLSVEQVRELVAVRRTVPRRAEGEPPRSGTGRGPATGRVAARAVAGVLAVVCVLPVGAGSPTQARFTAASTTPGNSFRTGGFCGSGPVYAATVQADQPVLQFRFDDTSTTVRDSAGSSDGVHVGAVVRDRRGAVRCDASRALGLDGSTAFVAAADTTRRVTGPQTFSVEVWFRTTQPQGRLIGFNVERRADSQQTDRHVYLDTGGRLVFGVFDETTHVVVSPQRYVDGLWHHVVGTFSASTGLRLYVDGTLVASDASTTRAEQYQGYWRVGQGRLVAWPGVSGDRDREFVAGDVDEVAVYATVLEADRVLAHWEAGHP